MGKEGWAVGVPEFINLSLSRASSQREEGDCVAPDLAPLATPRPRSPKDEVVIRLLPKKASQAQGGPSYNAVFILIPFNHCHYSFLQ